MPEASLRLDILTVTVGKLAIRTYMKQMLKTSTYRVLKLRDCQGRLIECWLTVWSLNHSHFHIPHEINEVSVIIVLHVRVWWGLVAKLRLISVKRSCLEHILNLCGDVHVR